MTGKEKCQLAFLPNGQTQTNHSIGSSLEARHYDANSARERRKVFFETIYYYLYYLFQLLLVQFLQCQAFSCVRIQENAAGRVARIIQGTTV